MISLASKMTVWDKILMYITYIAYHISTTVYIFIYQSLFYMHSVHWVLHRKYYPNILKPYLGYIGGIDYYNKWNGTLYIGWMIFRKWRSARDNLHDRRPSNALNRPGKSPLRPVISILLFFYTITVDILEASGSLICHPL